jgi:hypothetical protein
MSTKVIEITPEQKELLAPFVMATLQAQQALQVMVGMLLAGHGITEGKIVSASGDELVVEVPDNAQLEGDG